jgi:hypothetical protein
MSTRMRFPDRRPCETFQLEVANPDDSPTRPRGRASPPKSAQRCRGLDPVIRAEYANQKVGVGQ